MSSGPPSVSTVASCRLQVGDLARIVTGAKPNGPISHAGSEAVVEAMLFVPYWRLGWYVDDVDPRRCQENAQAEKQKEASSASQVREG